MHRSMVQAAVAFSPDCGTALRTPSVPSATLHPRSYSAWWKWLLALQISLAYMSFADNNTRVIAGNKTMWSLSCQLSSWSCIHYMHSQLRRASNTPQSGGVPFAPFVSTALCNESHDYSIVNVPTAVTIRAGGGQPTATLLRVTCARSYTRQPATTAN